MKKELRLTPCASEGQGVTVWLSREELWSPHWQAQAEDGSKVVYEGEAPLVSGQLMISEGRLFTLQQKTENVLVIPLAEKPELNAQLGWYFGNRHLPIEVRAHEIAVEPFGDLAESLDRIGISYERRREVLSCRPASEHTH